MKEKRMLLDEIYRVGQDVSKKLDKLEIDIPITL